MDAVYANEDTVLAELYGAMQTFRMLGFPSDRLYLAFGIMAVMGPYTGKKCVGVVLRWKDKEFVYHVAPVVNDRAFADRWQKHATEANPDDLGLKTAMLSSWCFQNKVLLVEALKKKGINPPLESS